MTEYLPILFSSAAGLVVGVSATRLWASNRSSSFENVAEIEVEKIRNAGKKEIEELKRAAEVEGKERALEIENQADQYAQSKREELARKSDALATKEAELEEARRSIRKSESDLSRRERSISGREKAAEDLVSKAAKAQKEARNRLETIADLSVEDARAELVKEMTSEARDAAAQEIKDIEDEAQKASDEISKTIIATAIQRHASEFVAERTVSVIPLPNDDMKGRLIGREGRNIRALEAAAGIDLIIDDTSEVITVSCFNPVRREIARIAIGKLVADGRIHPTRIEEVVRESRREVQELAKAAGEQAVFDLGLHKVHPELVRQLGRLKYRQSYAQNVLEHSIEVGFIAGLVAAEVGISVRLARRAGLLHDIGKGVDHEQEGSHAGVGAQFARKHGESARICQAIASHHGSPAPKSVLDHIVAAANALSAARPGARRELLASYIQRLEDLETSVAKIGGVHRVHAVQMGREIRVMVENDKVDDAQARSLSKEIAHQIETEATYAGEVRVVVVRETRASEYAR